MKAASRLSGTKNAVPHPECASPAKGSLPVSPLLLVILAGLISFAGCLRADFYMDDFGFILHSNKNEPAPRRFDLPGIPRFMTGKPGPDMQSVTVFQLVPTGFYLLTERMVPKDP